MDKVVGFVIANLVVQSLKRARQNSRGCDLDGRTRGRIDKTAFRHKIYSRRSVFKPAFVSLI